MYLLMLRVITNKNHIKKEAYLKPPFFISYLITDPKVYGNSSEKLTENLSKSFINHDINIVCFRDKESVEIIELAKTCLNVSKQFNIQKILINNNIDLAIKLGFDGVHLTSSQFDQIALAKKQNLFTLISTHTNEEIALAKKLGCDGVTYSPIFFKENKGEPKGIKNLSKIVQEFGDDDFLIIALGGIISPNHVEKIKTSNANGFASIRYFTS